MNKYFLGLGIVVIAACGDDTAGTPDAGTCADPPGPFAAGDTAGHPDPLGAGPTEARAGRVGAGDLPGSTLNMLTWREGDFVLANDKIAIVIEDVGDSDLYDPWGGRPVGLARVEGGALVDAADFGEHFFMTGPSTIATVSVTVLNDGSNGEAAVVRATGRLARLPFLDNIVSAVFFDDLVGIEAAMDYVLEPGAEHVDVYFRYGSARPTATLTGTVLHGFMFTPRMPTWIPGDGFSDVIRAEEWVALIDDDAASWAYQAPDQLLGSGIAQSGFVGAFTDEFELAACGETERHHARILIGGPGLDGLEQARARLEGRTLRTITGTVTDGAAPLAGANVHAVDAAGAHLTRVKTDETGAFTLHVPESAAVTLTAYRRGWATGSAEVAAGATTAAITVPASGAIRVRPREDGAAVPVRVQILPGAGTTLPSVPEIFGEKRITGGRLHVEYVIDDEIVLPVPAGSWDVVVSRGYEYEIVETTVTVAGGATVDVDAVLDRVVDTTGIQCGDFHIHSNRSNDARDDAEEKLRSAVADGLEIPLRTEHEWVDSYQPIIEELGLGAWAHGPGSLELTTFQFYGHFNVFPMDPDPQLPNNGAPRWQRWPTAGDEDRLVELIPPPELFASLRARPEQPAIIVNHPTGGSEYLGYTGFDPVTGLVERPDDWDEDLRLWEFFNDSGWIANRETRVEAWFGLLRLGRKAFAVGSSDTHGLSSSPVGYPRTCLAVGTDSPANLTDELVRDVMNAGASTISGGIYLDVSVGEAGPGETVTGAAATADVSIRVQAATWIDVDALEIVVDGETVATIDILPGDADPIDPVIRFVRDIPVDVAAEGSWVVVAAYGDEPLDPVHPGRVPFAVSNPIWIER